MRSTDGQPPPPSTRVEDACCSAAYAVVPLAWVALALRLPWLALLLGIVAFPLAVEGRIGGFIQLPLALAYIVIIVVAIVCIWN